MPKKIYIGNLEYSITEEDLQKIIEEKGFQVSGLNIVKDRFTGRSKGFGFAELESDELVQKAIAALDGYEFKGRKLRVNRARRQRPRFDNEEKF